MTQTAKFWMVVRAQPLNGSAPNVRHTTRKLAYVEAERLARKEGANFIVLEALDEVVAVPQPPVQQTVLVAQPPTLEWRRVRYRDPMDPEQVDTSRQSDAIEAVIPISSPLGPRPDWQDFIQNNFIQNR